MFLCRDKRDAVNLKDYTIENTEGGEVWRLPGSVNGQQFVIQNCKNSSIYVFDHINTVTIDDCINCKIILAAVTGRYVIFLYLVLNLTLVPYEILFSRTNSHGYEECWYIEMCPLFKCKV